MRVIAGTFDTSGPSAQYADMAKIVEAWAEYINGKGGLNGHPVEVERQPS